MKINFDNKDSYDRFGERAYKTWRNKTIIFWLIVLIVALGFINSLQIQNYLKSFATNRSEMVTRFYPLQEVESYKLVSTK